MERRASNWYSRASLSGRTQLPAPIRSEAWLLASGHAVVLVEQQAGGIALTHIEPATEPPEQHDAMMRLQLGEDIIRASRAKLEEMVKRHLTALKGIDFDVVIHALAQGATEQELTEMVFTVLLGEFGENLFADAAEAYKGIEDIVNLRKGGLADA
jgi:hypothetical protein